MSEAIETDFAYTDWYHSVTVDEHGTLTNVIDARLVNISKEIKTEISFPLWFERLASPEIVPERLGVWAEIRGKDLQVSFPWWDRKQGQGRVLFQFLEPLTPNRNLRLKWGYSCQRIYTEDTEGTYSWFRVPTVGSSGTFGGLITNIR